jgi:hypothetical protein
VGVEEGSLHRKVAVVLMGNQVVVVLQGSLVVVVVVVDMEIRNLEVDKGLEVLSGSCSFCEI